MSSIYKLIIGNREDAINFCRDPQPDYAAYRLIAIPVLERENIATLFEIMTDKKFSTDAYKSKIPLVYDEPSGPWLFEFPQELVTALSTLSSKSSLSEMARAWKENEPLFTRWKSSEVLDLLKTIQKACAESEHGKKQVFVFISN